MVNMHTPDSNMENGCPAEREMVRESWPIMMKEVITPAWYKAMSSHPPMASALKF
jgi:hypothetical protein